jgi:hypothetical protein
MMVVSRGRHDKGNSTLQVDPKKMFGKKKKDAGKK